MNTLDIQFIIAIIAGAILGYLLGALVQEQFDKKIIQKMQNHINDIEKELSK